MSTEHNKTVVRRFFEEMYEGNLDLAEELFAPDFGATDPAGHGPTGPARARHVVQRVQRAFPDIHFTVEDLIAERDRVAVRVTFRGTHQGEYLGVAPTGKQVTVTGLELIRFVDGKIVQGWHEYDALGLLRQLGVSL